MGSDANIYLFDDSVFSRVVAPAIHALVNDGAMPQWLRDLLVRLDTDRRPIDLRQMRSRGFSFHDVCSYLDRNFAFTPRGGEDWHKGWDARACPSATCPALSLCPLHQSAQSIAAEEFNNLFEAAVACRCLGQGQFLGRSVSPLWYFDELARMQIAPNHELYNLLHKLEFRGYVVGYQFGNSDGIHGWLYADETRRLVELLDTLRLPPVESDFHAMKSLYIPRQGYQVPAGWTFEQLSLAFLRNVARLATNEGKGVLWGNDILETCTALA